MVSHKQAAVLFAAVISIAVCGEVDARSTDEPIRLAWDEGDLAGITTIYDPESHEPIGVVEYRQERRGDDLTMWRFSRFRDGSSDEDWIVARVDRVLEAKSGRTVIRDERGEPTVDLSIDVSAGAVSSSRRSR